MRFISCTEPQFSTSAELKYTKVHNSIHAVYFEGIWRDLHETKKFGQNLHETKYSKKKKGKRLICTIY